MGCPACARPIATARPTCVYCGAPLSKDALEQAALAGKRVLQVEELINLEAAARGAVPDQPSRRYIVIDTADASVDRIASGCSVSAWEARQWQAASRYRLVKVTDEPSTRPLVVRLLGEGLVVRVIHADTVSRARSPIQIESIDASRIPALCSLRHDSESPAVRRTLPEQDLGLIISAAITREKVREPASPSRVQDLRLEDALFVHLHIKGETRPWEIDPRRARFEGGGLASGHMKTVQLVRRLAEFAPHDESFKNQVPALAEGADPLSELAEPISARQPARKGARLVVLDNLSQFREYSAWRGTLALASFDDPFTTGTKGGI